MADFSLLKVDSSLKSADNLRSDTALSIVTSTSVKNGNHLTSSDLRLLDISQDIKQALRLRSGARLFSTISADLGTIGDEYQYRCHVSITEDKILLPKFEVNPKWGNSIKLMVSAFENYSNKSITPDSVRIEVYNFDSLIDEFDLASTDRVGIGRYEVPFTIPYKSQVLRVVAKCSYRNQLFTDSLRLNCSQ